MDTEAEVVDISQVPDLIAPVVAYRMWAVTHEVMVTSSTPTMSTGYTVIKDSEPRLMSNGNTIWQPYERLEARHDPARMMELVGYEKVPHPQGADNEYSVTMWSKPVYRDIVCTGSPCDGHRPHHAPKCGIYGYKTLEALKADVRGLWTGFTWGSPSPYVYGAVKLWGRLVEHESGWRGQFAYPAYFVHGQGCDAQALADAYGIEYKEDTEWKSENQSDGSSLSQLAIQYPVASLRSLQISWSQHAFPVWRNQSLSPQHATHLLGRKRKGAANISAHSQPSFNLHKPLLWREDNAGEWTRVDRDQEGKAVTQ